MTIEPVLLWDLQHPCLIVGTQTNVSYTNQCGGVIHAHPIQEGYLVPLPPFCFGQENILAAEIQDVWHFAPPAKKPHAQCRAIRKALHLWELSPRIGPLTLDEARMGTACWGEAWLPVQSKLGPAILTWDNSD